MNEFEKKMQARQNVEVVEDGKENAPATVEEFPQEEDLEKLSGEVIQKIELAGSSLDSPQGEIDKLASSLGVDERQVLAEDPEVYNDLRSISEKAKGVVEKAKEKIKKVLAVGMATITFSGAVDLAHADEVDLSEENREEVPNLQKSGGSTEEEIIQEALKGLEGKRLEAAKNKEMVLKLAESIEKKEWTNSHEMFKELRDAFALYDDFEREILIVEKEGIFRVAKNEKEGAFSAHVDFDDIEKLIEDGAKKVVVAHDHPMGIAGGEFFDTKLAIPPSITDIRLMAGLNDYFKGNSSKLKNVVFTPAGYWEYSFVRSSSFEKMLVELSKWAEMDIVSEMGLSKEEVELYEEKAEQEKNNHPALVFGAILNSLLDDSNKEAAELGGKILGYTNKQVTKMKERYPEEFGLYLEIFNNEAQPRGGAEFIEGSEVTKEILSMYEKAGIDVKYTSFDLPEADEQNNFNGKDPGEIGSNKKFNHFDK